MEAPSALFSLVLFCVLAGRRKRLTKYFDRYGHFLETFIMFETHVESQVVCCKFR